MARSKGCHGSFQPCERGRYVNHCMNHCMIQPSVGHVRQRLRAVGETSDTPRGTHRSWRRTPEGSRASSCKKAQGHQANALRQPLASSAPALRQSARVAPTGRLRLRPHGWCAPTPRRAALISYAGLASLFRGTSAGQRRTRGDARRRQRALPSLWSALELTGARASPRVYSGLQVPCPPAARRPT